MVLCAHNFTHQLFQSALQRAKGISAVRKKFFPAARLAKSVILACFVKPGIAVVAADAAALRLRIFKSLLLGPALGSDLWG